MFTVIVSEKGGAQKRLEFDEEELLIGRVQGNQIILPMGNVSKRHAKLEQRRGHFVLTDLGSTNGTYVNGRRVHEPHRIYKGDKIYIGEFILGLELGGEGITVEPALGSAPPPAPPEAKHKAAIKSAKKPVPKPKSKPAPQAPIAPAKPEKPARREEHLPRPKVARTPTAPPNNETATTKQLASAPPAEARETLATEEGAPKRTPELSIVIDSLLDQIARKIKRVDRAQIPAKFDMGVAGQVRILTHELVVELARRGKLPEGIPPADLAGKVLRSVVDLEPLSSFIEDPEVAAVRVIDPDNVRVLKAGSWRGGNSGFVSRDELTRVANCLGAGLETRDDGHPGVVGFRLEEGHLVCTMSEPTAVSGPAITVQKITGGLPDQAPSNEILPPAAREVIDEGISSRTKIAVIGDSRTARLALVNELVKALPKTDLVVIVEDLPVPQLTRSSQVRLSITRPSPNDEAGSLKSILQRTADMEPDWLVVTGSGLSDLPVVLSSASQRLGVIVELPLGGIGTLDAELSLALTTTGTVADKKSVARMFETAFDLIAVAKRRTDGALTVQSILSAAITDKGRWAPKTLFRQQEQK